jgi:hypothetical protein
MVTPLSSLKNKAREDRDLGEQPCSVVVISPRKKDRDSFRRALNLVISLLKESIIFVRLTGLPYPW